MIDCGLFHFACPPRTGSLWFVKALGLALPTFQGLSNRHAHSPFDSDSDESVFRVTLVRHPVSWLASVYTALEKRPLTFDGRWLDDFVTLDPLSFDGFVRAYLEFMPGSVGKLYGNYEADSCLRIEDMPHAFVELMESFGLSCPSCQFLPKQNASQNVPSWDKRLRSRVMDAEEKVLNGFDYC